MDVSGVTTYEMPIPATMSTPLPGSGSVSPSAPQPVSQPATNTKSSDVKTTASIPNPDQAEKTERPQSTPPQMDALEKAIAQVNKSISTFNREMHISMHEKTRRIMVKVMDTEENRVIREIPPEKVLDAFARTLELAGILVDKSS